MCHPLNKKLDMTIEALGRKNVYKKLGGFEKLLYLGTDSRSRILMQYVIPICLWRHR